MLIYHFELISFMKYLILVLGLIIAFSGCSEPVINEMPDDFSFEYSTGAMHAEWGVYSFNSDTKGNSKFVVEAENEIKKSQDFQVSEDDRQKVYNAVMINNFFDLQSEYTDAFIMDGGFSKISVTANGQSKTVTLNNFHQDKFENVQAAINEIILKYVGEDAYSFD